MHTRRVCIAPRRGASGAGRPEGLTEATRKKDVTLHTTPEGWYVAHTPTGCVHIRVTVYVHYVAPRAPRRGASGAGSETTEATRKKDVT